MSTLRRTGNFEIAALAKHVSRLPGGRPLAVSGRRRSVSTMRPEGRLGASGTFKRCKDLHDAGSIRATKRHQLDYVDTAFARFAL